MIDTSAICRFHWSTFRRFFCQG